MPITPEAHAAILRRVAAAALTDARVAWTRSIQAPTERRVRAAYRAALLAERTIRKAAAVTPDQAAAMLEEAALVGATARKLQAQLVRIVEGIA